jgi:hypothetical protein
MSRESRLWDVTIRTTIARPPRWRTPLEVFGATKFRALVEFSLIPLKFALVIRLQNSSPVDAQFET